MRDKIKSQDSKDYKSYPIRDKLTIRFQYNLNKSSHKIWIKPGRLRFSATLSSSNLVSSNCLKSPFSANVPVDRHCYQFQMSILLVALLHDPVNRLLLSAVHYSIFQHSSSSLLHGNSCLSVQLEPE